MLTPTRYEQKLLDQLADLEHRLREAQQQRDGARAGLGWHKAQMQQARTERNEARQERDAARRWAKRWKATAHENRKDARGAHDSADMWCRRDNAARAALRKLAEAGQAVMDHAPVSDLVSSRINLRPLREALADPVVAAALEGKS